MGEGWVVRFLRVRSRTKTRVPFNVVPKAHWPEVSTEAMMPLWGSRGDGGSEKLKSLRLPTQSSQLRKLYSNV